MLLINLICFLSCLLRPDPRFCRGIKPSAVFLILCIMYTVCCCRTESSESTAISHSLCNWLSGIFVIDSNKNEICPTKNVKNSEGSMDPKIHLVSKVALPCPDWPERVHSQFRYHLFNLIKDISGVNSNQCSVYSLLQVFEKGYCDLHHVNLLAKGSPKLDTQSDTARGADVDGKDPAGQTALHWTCYLTIVKILVDGGANVNVQDEYICTTLMIHAEEGSKDIVSYLIAHGADVGRKDPAGKTALHITGHLTIFEILIDGGANINLQDDKGCTPLMIHAGNGNKDIVSYLIGHGADIHRKDSRGQTALHYVCPRGQLWGDYTLSYVPKNSFDLSYCMIVKLLVDHGSNIEERDCCQFTSLVHAALTGNQILAWQLIECGADVKQLSMTKEKFNSQYNESRETQGRIEHFTYSNLRLCKEAFLMRAAFTGNTEIVKTLTLACNVDVNCKDKSTGDTPLHVAARGNYIQCVILLVEAGSSTEIRNKSSRKPLDLASSSYIETLLMTAAFTGNTEIVKTLILTCSVDVNCKDESTGDTPLHVATGRNRVKCGILLVEAGSSTGIYNKSSQKPLDLASKGFIEAIKQTLSFTGRKTVCIIGNACSGKSTIIASQQNENALIYKKIVHWFHGVDDISQHTAGINPVLIGSQNYGNIIFFDFAGQNEYHGPHEMFLQSILSKSRSTVTIIVVVKVTEEEAVISQQLHHWLYPLSTMSVTASNPIRVIIIGSFLDKVRYAQVAIDKVNRCCSELEHSLSGVPINIEGQCFFNCRQPYSSDFNKLHVYLRDVPIPEFRALDTPYSICWVISHMKKLTERKSIRLSVFEEWIQENRANLPVNMPSVEKVCKDLSSMGHFLYIPNNEKVKNGWLVLDLPAILHEVYSKLYAPSQRTANEFGLLNCRKLVNLFSDFNQTMIRDVLIAMESCIDIDPKFFREEVVKLLSDHEQSHDFLFFPTLISSDIAYVDIFTSNPSSEIHHTLCWHLQAHKQHLITPRLLQTSHVQFPTSERTEPLCSVWSKGYNISLSTLVALIRLNIARLNCYKLDEKRCKNTVLTAWDKDHDTPLGVAFQYVCESKLLAEGLLQEILDMKETEAYSVSEKPYCVTLMPSNVVMYKNSTSHYMWFRVVSSSELNNIATLKLSCIQMVGSRCQNQKNSNVLDGNSEICHCGFDVIFPTIILGPAISQMPRPTDVTGSQKSANVSIKALTTVFFSAAKISRNETVRVDSELANDVPQLKTMILSHKESLMCNGDHVSSPTCDHSIWNNAKSFFNMLKDMVFQVWSRIVPESSKLYEPPPFVRTMWYSWSRLYETVHQVKFFFHSTWVDFRSVCLYLQKSFVKTRLAFSIWSQTYTEVSIRLNTLRSLNYFALPIEGHNNFGITGILATTSKLYLPTVRVLERVHMIPKLSKIVHPAILTVLEDMFTNVTSAVGPDSSSYGLEMYITSIILVGILTNFDNSEDSEIESYAATIRSLLSLLSKRPNEKSTRLCQFSASEFIEQYIADPIVYFCLKAVEVFLSWSKMTLEAVSPFDHNTDGQNQMDKAMSAYPNRSHFLYNEKMTFWNMGAKAPPLDKVSEVPFQILYHLYCVACVALVIGILSRIADSPLNKEFQVSISSTSIVDRIYKLCFHPKRAYGTTLNDDNYTDCMSNFRGPKVDLISVNSQAANPPEMYFFTPPLCDGEILPKFSPSQETANQQGIQVSGSSDSDRIKSERVLLELQTHHQEDEPMINDDRGDKNRIKSFKFHDQLSKIQNNTQGFSTLKSSEESVTSLPSSTVNAVDQSSPVLPKGTKFSLSTRKEPVGQEEVDSPPPQASQLPGTLSGLSSASGLQKAKASTGLSSSGYKTDSNTQRLVPSTAVPSQQQQAEDFFDAGDKVVQSVSNDDSGKEVVVSRCPETAESFQLVDYCLSHVPSAPPSNTSHTSHMVVSHSSSKPLIKIIKHNVSEMSSAKTTFKPRMFLDHLNLHNFLKMTEFTDIPSHIIKRARLEYLYKSTKYKHFCDAENAFNEGTIKDILSCFPWLSKNENRVLEQKLSTRRRHSWNALKGMIRAVDMVNLSTLASKFSIRLHFPIDPAFDEFEGILEELFMVHREWGFASMTKSQVIHALFVTSSPLAPMKLLDKILLEGLSVKINTVTISDVSQYVPLLEKDQNLDTFFEVILDDVIDWRDSDPVKALPTSDKSASSITHCLAVWLAIRAESSYSPVTWEDFMDVLRKSGLHGRIGSEIAKRQGLEFSYGFNSFSDPTESVNRLKNDVPYSIERVQSPTPHRRYEKEPTRIQAPTDDHAKVDHMSSASYQIGSNKSLVSSNNAASLPLAKENSINDQEEATLLSKKLDPGNPKSILAHAKSVYLTGDYNRTREILDNFNHHLTVEGKMLRAKIFGLGICHYREKDYPVAVKYLDELERVALEHNAAGDVAVSFIYRGEIHLAQGKYLTAYEMFTRARTAYGTDHVAHLYGIVILSKTSVIIKAANCQKHLKNISKAKELFHTAVELAVRSRESAESSSNSLDRKYTDTLRALYKDEIAARTSLGNLHQNISDCSKSLEEYRIALKLQEKVDTNCIAYGWAQGNMGSALVGRGKVKEAIPHLIEAYNIAKKFERDYSAVGRAANNLGTAFQADKQHRQAEDYFQIALGHSVYCKDEVGQARSLGNIGNVKLLQGELMEALRCYTETLSLGCDDNALITAYQNRAGVYIALAKQLARGNDWDEVSSDVESVQPKEIQSAEIPVQECTEHHPTENRRLQLVAPVGTYTQLPLDDEEDILNEKQSSPTPSFERGRRTDSIRQQPLTAFDVLHSDDLTVKHRKYYLERAKEDLLQSIELIEKKFDTLKGEDTNSLALSLFEVNAKAFYNLQKVLVLLGDPQGALKVAEQNRGRNLGEILWNKRQQASNIPCPLDLRHIWRVVNRERTPVIVLSYIQQSSTMLIHMVFPGAKSDSFCRGEEGTDFYRESGGAVHSEDRLFHTIFHTPALANGSDDECGPQIPPDNYHFMKVDLPKEDFLNKNYGPFSKDNKEENVSFDQFVMKTLMSYLNQREIELFTPIDYQDDESPLTILFEKITRRFVEVLEHKFPEEREIIVIADQAAHFFPWPLLQDESTKVFLGDRYRVRTYPSILTMGVINHQKPRTIELPSEESFLVVGNPATPKFQHGGKEVTLGRLPHSETEALQVAHILETTPLLKEMATKPSVLYRLQTAQIIHIATHSSAVHGYLAFASSVPIVNSAKPVDSKEALIFIDEIQKLHINASLVVLSACDSARGQLVNEGVNSVARAFLAAGAQSVLVSLVRVPDKSASIFMSMFYRFLTHNEFTTSEAMQKSSMAIRCIKTLSQHIHWGGFQLVGRNIRMKYNKDCHPAKVAALVGETSPFPRLSIVQELEKAIFRQDRTPPRDVVLVKGMTAHDPAEIVRDFVVKRSKLFPGGVFWYNCSTPELLEASVTSVKKTLPHLKTIRKDPPKQTKRIDRKESMDPVPLFVEHYRLIILDSPFSLVECTRAIPDLKDQEVDIVIIDNMEANRDRKLSDFADSVLIRGCATIEVSDIDRYTSIQRMAYRLLCEQEFCPYEEDYEAFETIVRFCRGSSVLVKVFEGLLTSKEKGVLQSIAKDIDQVKEVVISDGDTHTSLLQQTSLPSSHQSVSLASSLSSFQREVGKKVGRLGKKAKEAKLTPPKSGLVESHNGLITAGLAKRLSDEDCVLLSEGIEKVPGLMDPFCNFLYLRLSTEAHTLLQFLSYISGYPNVDSERPFVFPESFVNQLSTIVANSTQSFSSSAIVGELRRMNLILLYPQPVLSPPERAVDENLLYVPDIIGRIATYDIDEADITFILNISSAVISQTNGILSPVYLKPVVSSIVKLTECQRMK